MAIEWGTRLPRQDDARCRECNGVFVQQRSNQAFCSKECRVAWHVRRDLKKRRASPRVEVRKPKARLSEKLIEESGIMPYMYSATVDKAPLDAVSDHERVTDDLTEVLALINGSQLVWAHHIDHQHPDDPYLRLDIVIDARIADDPQTIKRLMPRPRREDPADGGPRQP